MLIVANHYQRDIQSDLSSRDGVLESCRPTRVPTEEKGGGGGGGGLANYHCNYTCKYPLCLFIAVKSQVYQWNIILIQSCCNQCNVKSVTQRRIKYLTLSLICMDRLILQQLLCFQVPSFKRIKFLLISCGTTQHPPEAPNTPSGPSVYNSRCWFSSSKKKSQRTVETIPSHQSKKC